jgi:hypothetical protein
MIISHKGQQSLTKLNAEASSIYVEVFLAYVVLWWEFKLCHTGTYHVAFLCFSKDNSPEL